MNQDKEKDEVVLLHLDDIIPNRFQPREVFDEKALKELAVSIKEHGVIQPIIVRSVNGKYEIIAGERRYKASALAGLTKIPAIIRDLDDKESSKVALLENLQRKNLNAIEEARTYQKILEIDEMTQEELAKTMGKSQSAVANKIRLLSLPEEIQEALLKEQISERHARSLLNIPDAKKQKDMLKQIIDTKMSVRQLEEEIKKEYPKEQDESTSESEISTPTDQAPEQTPSINNFVNTSPLMPTADLPEDTSNYGKVTIAPPDGEEMPAGIPKFINYGEIEDDDDDDETEQPGGLDSSIIPVDIDNVKENSMDINNTSENAADLDNMLNLNNAKVPTGDTDTNFITPAEKIVKTDSTEMESTEDYFKTPDLSAINIPTMIPTINSQNSQLTSVKSVTDDMQSTTYTLEQATTKLKDLIKDLNDHSIKASYDEMHFDKSYQMIIKIEKDQLPQAESEEKEQAGE